MKPGIKTIIFGAVLLISGAVILPVFFILSLISGRSTDAQFKVPGVLETNIEKPGRYYLCNDFQTIYNGKTYDSPTNLPGGMEIKIFDANSNAIPFIADRSFSEGSRGSDKKSIGYVDINNKGKIRIEVSGGNEERIFSFGPLNFFKFIGLIFAAFGSCALATAAGIAVVIWGIVKFAKSRR